MSVHTTGRTAISKKDILDAATVLFLEEGYENVLMRKIAVKIGCSPTNLYNHYHNKEEILLFLLKDGYAIFLKYLADARSAHEDEAALIKLKAVMRAYVQFGFDNPGYYKLMFIHNFEHYDRVAEGVTDRLRGFQVLVDLIEEAIAAKLIASREAFFASQSVWAAVHGITALLMMFSTFDWMNKEALVEFHLDACVKGLQ